MGDILVSISWIIRQKRGKGNIFLDFIINNKALALRNKDGKNWSLKSNH